MLQTLSPSRFHAAFNSCSSLLKSWTARFGRQKSRRRAKLLTDQCDSLEPRQLLTAITLGSATYDQGILTLDIENGNGKYFTADLDADSITDESGTVTDGQLSFTVDSSITEVQLRFYTDQSAGTEIGNFHVPVVTAYATLNEIGNATHGGLEGSIVIPNDASAVSLNYRLPGTSTWNTLWETSAMTGTVDFTAFIPGVQMDTDYEFMVVTQTGPVISESPIVLFMIEAADAEEDPFL